MFFDLSIAGICRDYVNSLFCCGYSLDEKIYFGTIFIVDRFLYSLYSGGKRSYSSSINGDEIMKSAVARLQATGIFTIAAIRNSEYLSES